MRSSPANAPWRPWVWGLAWRGWAEARKGGSSFIGLARELKAAGHEVVTGKRTLAALGVVVGVAVLREGSEVVLFLYGIAAQGGTSNAGLLTGGALGLAAGAAVSALMYFGLLTIPAGRLFQVTAGLITLLAAGMAAQAVLFLQNGGYINAMTGTIWDTSWLLK